MGISPEAAAGIAAVRSLVSFIGSFGDPLMFMWGGLLILVALIFLSPVILQFSINRVTKFKPYLVDCFFISLKIMVIVAFGSIAIQAVILSVAQVFIVSFPSISEGVSGWGTIIDFVVSSAAILALKAWLYGYFITLPEFLQPQENAPNEGVQSRKLVHRSIGMRRGVFVMLTYCVVSVAVALVFAVLLLMDAWITALSQH